jgi:hypothetical protein
MGIDHPDDADVPPDKRPDHPADRAPADRVPADRVPPETRYRQEAYDDLHAADAARERTEPTGRSEPDARSKPEEQTEPAKRPEPEAESTAGEQTENGQHSQPGSTWEEKAEQSLWMWSEYKRRWPPEERPPVDRSADPPGSWRGDGGRFLDSAINERIEAECDRIADLEREKIAPALRAIESQDPDRYLVGLKDCLKGRDRIKEKVAKNMAEKGLTPEDAILRVPDTIRYTFQYDEARYTQGVREDIVRMKEQGFKPDISKNSWLSDQYKGINSQWIEPDTGQRFEVQFHTRVSFEAKQITHPAYERLRTLKADEFEEMVLEAFQKKVTAEVTVPPGAADIPDYPERSRDAT